MARLEEVAPAALRLTSRRANNPLTTGLGQVAEDGLAAAAKRATEQQAALAASTAEVDRLSKALAAAKAAAATEAERLNKALTTLAGAKDAAVKEGERLTAEGKQKDADNAALKKRVAELEAALAAMTKVRPYLARI